MRAAVTFLLLAVAAVAVSAETSDDVRSVDAATVSSIQAMDAFAWHERATTTLCMVELATPTPSELEADLLMRAPRPAGPALTARCSARLHRRSCSAFC